MLSARNCRLREIIGQWTAIALAMLARRSLMGSDGGNCHDREADHFATRLRFFFFLLNAHKAERFLVVSDW